MTIVLTGGGTSAGHITPNLAIARELKKLEPTVKIVYIGHKGDKLGDLAAEHDSIDKVYLVRAGKLRRYHGAFWRQLIDFKTLAKNIRDVWWVLVGIIQSRKLLKRLKPECVFIKGSYVGLVVGLASAWLKLPYITHDSDTIPGLGNRMIARWAKLHAVALPKGAYPYSPDKTITVGVPIRPEFKQVNAQDKKGLKLELGFAENDKLLFITGGGQGSRRLNEAIIKVVPTLLDKLPNLKIVHLAGRTNEEEVRKRYDATLSKTQHSNVLVKGFAPDLYKYSGAADVIVSRAGATNIAEFALQAKACIFVPNPYLTGGHQLKNADLLEHAGAAKIIDEDNLSSSELSMAIVELLDSETARASLSGHLQTFAKPNAARDLAKLLIDIARSKNNKPNKV